MADNKFGEYFDSLDQQRVQRAGGVLASVDKTPDQAAEVRSVAREVGVQPYIVSTDPEFYKGLMARKRATTALSSAPKTAEWLANPENAALAGDDVESVTGFEGVGNSLARFGYGWLQSVNQQLAGNASRLNKDGQRSFSEIVYDQRTPILDDQGKEVARELPGPADLASVTARWATSRIAQMFGVDSAREAEDFQISAGYYSKRASETPMTPGAEAIRQRLGQFKPSGSWSDDLANFAAIVGSDPAGFASFIAQVGAESAPNMLASALTVYLTKNPVAGASVAAAASGLSERGRAPMEVFQDAGYDMSTLEGVQAALADESLMREAAERGDIRGMVIGALDGLSAGAAGTMLANSPVGNFLLQSITQSVLGGGGEALAQVATGEEINLAEVLVEALAEFATAPIEVLSMGGGKMPKMLQRLSGAGQTESVLTELDQMAAGSKLRARAPDKFMEALEAQGLGDAEIYVPAEAVREYFQQEGMEFDADFMEAWGISADAWEVADASNGDIAIPISAYAANLSGTPAADVILKHGTMNPDGEMSADEASRFNAEWRDVMDRELQEIEARRVADLQARNDLEQIRDDLFGQLRAGTTHSPDVVEAETALWVSAFEQAGQLSGKSPLELWNRYRVRVLGQASEGMVRRRNQLDADLNTIRAAGVKKGQTAQQQVEAARKQVLEQFPELKQKRPFTRALIGRGGIAPTIMRDGVEVPSPAAAELAARGINTRTAPGLFRRGGVADLDNIVASEIFQSPVLQEDGNGYLSPDAVIEAIEREAAGQQVPYSAEAVAALDALASQEAALEGQEIPDAPATYAARFGGQPTNVGQLAQALDEQGVDLDAMSNDEVAALLGLGDVRPASPAADGMRYEQSPDIETPDFKAWFGDSKVVDADGKPLVVYHGTDAKFDAFDLSNAGATDPGLVGAGVYLTPDRRLAEGYGGNVVEAYASIQNPMIIEDGMMPDGTSLMDAHNGKLTKAGAKKLNAAVKKAGHDGVIFRQFGEISQVVAFKPEQVKSINNRGTWDANDARILYQGYSELRSNPSLGGGETPAVDYVVSDLGGAVISRDYDYSGFGDEVVIRVGETDLQLSIREDETGVYLTNIASKVAGVLHERRSGSGVGSAAIRALKSYSDRTGKPFAVVGSTEPARGFYEKMGMVAEDVTLFMDDGYLTAPASGDGGGGFVYSPSGAGRSINQGARYEQASSFDGSEGTTPYDVRNSPGFMDKAEAYARSGLESPVGFKRRASQEMFADDGSFRPSDEDLSKIARIVARDNLQAAASSQPEAVEVEIPAVVDEGDYRMSHKAPNAQDGSPAHALAGGVYPDDLFSSDGFRFYADHGKSYDRKTYDVVRSVQGNPDAIVTIYRSVPKGVSEINMGDWVSLTREYAQDHGDANLSGEYDILEMQVPARDIFTNGDSLDEWGWSPDGKVYFQREDVGPLGSVQFPAGGIGRGDTVIQLFEGANLSTFLHESGHFFLEMYSDLAADPQASPELTQMMATVRDWLGAKPGEAFTTAQHEKWARGFEAYLMEGKAPSLELADAFSRFKGWLTRVYESLKALRVNLKPEVREVMDRMLASDAAIAEARATYEVGPMFAERGPAGMSEQDWQTYRKVAQREVSQAETQAMKKMMDKVRRETLAWYKEAKAATTKEVTREFSTMRNFRAVSVMANKSWLDGGQGVPVPDIRLNRADLVEMYGGEGILQEISKAKLGGGRAIYGADGVPPQVAADMFGYASVKEMIEDLQNTPKLKDAIRNEVERRMVEEHGDPLSDGTIEEVALAALHNEAKGQRDMIELRSIGRRLGKPEPRGRMYKARARVMLGAMSVREASKPQAFLRAERKAASEAQAAFAAVVRGGAQSRESLEAAYAAKEREVLNHYLYKEARDFETAVKRGRERFRSYSSPRVRQAIGSPHIERIDDLLETYEFRQRSERWVSNREGLRAYIDAMTAEGREQELSIDPEVAAQADRVHYTRMKVDEFYGLVDTVRNIESLGRLKDKLRTAQKERSERATIEAIQEQFAQNVKKRGRSREKDAAFTRRKLGRDVLNWTLNADTHLREIDGFKDGGPAWDGIKADVDAGLSRLTARKVEVSTEFNRIFSAFTDAEKRDMTVKRPNRHLGGDFSKWAVIVLALNSGNRDNWQRLTNLEAPGTFDQTAIDGALSELSEKDWRFVQDMLDYINTFWDDIAAKEKRMTGVSPRKVEAEVMSGSAPSWFRGGYYPIKYDAEISGRADDLSQQAVADQLRGGRMTKAATAKGHTKERSASARQPVNLDIGMSLQHVNDVIYDLELGEAVSNSWRLLSKLKDTFYEYGKQSDYAALESWLKDVAAGERTAAHGWGKFMQAARSGFTFSRLALNLVTVMLQPTGIAQSFVVVGKGAMARGLGTYLRNPGRWADDIIAASPMMSERQNTFQRDLHDLMGKLDTAGMTGGRWSKLQREYIVPLSFLLMQKVQFYTVDAPTWVAGYEREIAAGKSEESARATADMLVKRAQGSGLISDRGMLERGKFTPSQEMNEMPKLLTALGSYMFAKFNVAYERTMGTNWRSPADAMLWAADMAILFALEAALAGVVRGSLPEDEPFWEWMLKETGLSVMGTVPFARDAASGLQGFSSGGSAASVIDLGAVRPVLQLADLISEDGEFDRKKITTAIDAVGIWFNLPSAQVNRMIKAMLEDDLSSTGNGPVSLLGFGQGDGQTIFEYFGAN